MATPAKQTRKSTADFQSNPFKVIFDGFNRLMNVNKNMGIILIVFGGLSFVANFIDSGEKIGTETTGTGTANSVSVVAIVLIIALIVVLAIFITTMLSGFMSYVAYKTMQGETTTLKEALRAVWRRFWTILWTNIIVGAKVLGGTLLFIIPGIRASMRYNMVLLPIFVDKTDAKGAVAKSKNLTKNHLIEIFGMNVAAGIIPVVGQAMLVGGQSVMYRQLEQLKASDAPKPPVHWLNYLGFVLVFVFVLAMLAIASLVVLFINSQT